ncbi:MAG: hypothetical protein IK093_19395 [Ruminiclostridium sp.]|nr:hypothetical protein [Ruminiclostridium sp.]
MRKIFNNNGLKDPLFIGNPAVGSAERHDIKLGGITYRVWSVFASEGEPSDRLADLMQSSVESEEQVGEVYDWQLVELGKMFLEARQIQKNREKGLPDDYGLPLEIKVFDKSEMWKTVDNGV